MHLSNPSVINFPFFTKMQGAAGYQNSGVDDNSYAMPQNSVDLHPVM